MRDTPKLLNSLKEADSLLRTGCSKMCETRTKVTYEHKVEGVGKKTITFVKVEKYWYIKN
jgi:hypothetical protein